MCGIMGVAGAPALSPFDMRLHVRRMGQLLMHRGPDEWGEFSAPGVALGHTRLSILDLEHGKQPMVSEDGALALAYNGEVYNYASLWRELQAKGHRFRTHHSDTEVILNGYREWGLDVFDRLDGMFAAAIWDAAARTLVLARDRTGIKPLYYAQLPQHGIVFASEPKAILQSGLVAAPFEPAALAEYFTHRAVAAPRTFWRGISKLPAAHILSYPEGAPPSVKRYWTPRADARPRLRMSEAADVIGHELAQAVESHLISDVPVGIFLSGGVDSALVAAFASRRARPHAFTIGTRSELDESPFAAEVAHRFGLTQHCYYVDPGDFAAALDEWVYFNDDPVSDPSALALFLLSRRAREEGMKVMLSGEGSDELFCGYSSYVRYKALNSITRVPFARKGLRLLRTQLDARTVDYLDQPGALAFAGTGHVTTARMRSEMFVDMPQDEATLTMGLPDRHITPLRGALLFDQLVRLPNDILARTDRATMAAGIEARVPFLDRRVVEAANSLDDACCLHPYSFRTKRVLKTILARHLPPRLVYRKKLGFDLPIAGWLRTEFRPLTKVFLSDRLIPGMNYSFWSRLYAAHCVGGSDHAAPLWAWLVLERWYRRWVEDSRATPAASQPVAVGTQPEVEPAP